MLRYHVEDRGAGVREQDCGVPLAFSWKLFSPLGLGFHHVKMSFVPAMSKTNAKKRLMTIGLKRRLPR
jgi:hypothetical protein